MRIFSDVLLILIATIIAIRSLELIIRYKTKSLADWAILLLYIFQIVPVILDFIFGLPKYDTWFSNFALSMSDDTTCVIYDAYVLGINLSLLTLSFVSQNSSNYVKTSQFWKSKTRFKFSNVFLAILISLPFLQILFSGEIGNFLTYQSIGGRNVSNAFQSINSELIIVSILALILWYFRKPRCAKRLVLFCFLAFGIVWISGKRYTIATFLFGIVYMNVLTRSKSKQKINLRLFLIIGVVGTLVYSMIYATSIKVIAGHNFDSLYKSFRIDFGRDDVVKFVIWKEYVKGEHILEYPLQTVISTLFMVVPRSIFQSKGYPHYLYLTAAIYGTDIYSVNAGMTPSILEMMVANFGYFGPFVCILFLCWYCRKADSAKSDFQRFCYAIVMMGMLSQSMDAMVIPFYMTLFFALTSGIRFESAFPKRTLMYEKN